MMVPVALPSLMIAVPVVFTRLPRSTVKNSFGSAVVSPLTVIDICWVSAPPAVKWIVLGAPVTAT